MHLPVPHHAVNLHHHYRRCHHHHHLWHSHWLWPPLWGNLFSFRGKSKKNMKHVSDSPLGPKGLIKAAESPEFCCGCYGCYCCCCFFLSAFCLLYVCSLFFVGPFALDNLTSLKYVAFVICFLVPILVPGPRVLAAAAAAADNATFGGIGAIKLLLYIFFFCPTAAATQRHFMLWQAHTTLRT